MTSWQLMTMTEDEIHECILEVRRMLGIENDKQRLMCFAQLSTEILASRDGYGVLADLMKVYAEVVGKVFEAGTPEDESMELVFGLLNHAIEGQLGISEGGGDSYP